MVTNKPRLLFLVNSLSLSGSPKVVLLFLEWINTYHPAYVTVISLEGGPLQKTFSRYAEVVVINSEITVPGLVGHLLRAILNGLWMTKLKLKIYSLYNRSRLYDVIFANSLNSFLVFDLVRDWGKKSFVYVHELSYAFNAVEQFSLTYLQKKLSRILFHEETIIIAGSYAVKRFLEKKLDLASDQIMALCAYSRTIKIAEDTTVGRMKHSRRLADDGSTHLSVGCCGSLDWRKGADIMVQLAAYLVNNLGRTDVKFVWVGSGDVVTTRCLQYDIDKQGLNNFIRLEGNSDSLNEFYTSMDLFLLLSREDPFPLVMIEAAATSCPVAGFLDSGGIEEFLKGTPELLVPYMNIAKMAELVLRLKENPAQRLEFGKQLQRRAIEDYDVSVQAPKLWSIIFNGKN